MIPLTPQAIAQALGGSVTGRDSVSVPGPGHSPKDRSLSIKLNARAPGGFVVFSHSGDDPLVCRDFIRERLGLGDWRNDAPVPVVCLRAATGKNADNERTEFALKIWRQSIDPRGTIVEEYLRKHRGIELPDAVAGTVIRFHGSLKYDDRRLPGMVCLLRNVFSDEPSGVHRTFLDRSSAEKVDRRMLGIAKDAAIKFDTASEHLAIGEGVETVLAGRAAGLAPAWAMGSSVAIRNFPLLKGLREISIFGEHDAASRRDVKVCSQRYLAAGRPVNVVLPRVGKDLNDSWRATR